MRHLYAEKDQEVIAVAKNYERRRCNHHTLDKPLSSFECLSSVVDPKESLTNKHRYVVASQDPRVRAHMRTIPGVPLVYVARSVMIMEPMAEATEDVRLKEERTKFRQGLKMRINPNTVLGKRAREELEEEGPETGGSQNGQAQDLKKTKQKSQKGPNPLSVKKPKSRSAGETALKTNRGDIPIEEPGPLDHEGDASSKRKRKRKPSKRMDGGVEVEEE
jgi:U3 small nucleolar RNA-associated protein 23